MPIGSKGVAMVDTRDLGEVAAIELIRRDQAPGNLPIEIINVVGSDTLTGVDVATIWTEVLGYPVAYGGSDPSGFEKNMATSIPKWMAYELRLMAERYVSDSMILEAGDRERLTVIPGRPLHTYHDFAAALVAQGTATAWTGLPDRSVVGIPIRDGALRRRFLLSIGLLSAFWDGRKEWSRSM